MQGNLRFYFRLTSCYHQNRREFMVVRGSVCSEAGNIDLDDAEASSSDRRS